jgi:hypothetical protein
MSQPPEGFNPAPFAGQTKTMFYNEGNSAALLVTNRRGRRIHSSREFARAEAALAWCRAHGVMLVYLPARLEGN